MNWLQFELNTITIQITKILVGYVFFTVQTGPYCTHTFFSLGIQFRLALTTHTPLVKPLENSKHKSLKLLESRSSLLYQYVFTKCIQSIILSTLEHKSQHKIKPYLFCALKVLTFKARPLIYLLLKVAIQEPRMHESIVLGLRFS